MPGRTSSRRPTRTDREQGLRVEIEGFKVPVTSSVVCVPSPSINPIRVWWVTNPREAAHRLPSTASAFDPWLEESDA
jgi:hypothetical protein